MLNFLDWYAQNFYVLKIRLNLFEISTWVFSYENLIWIWHFLSCLKIYFKHGPWGVVPCACIQVYHVSGVHVWNRFSDRTNFFRFKLNFKILKLYLRFQINSNGFSRDRSFGHSVYFDEKTSQTWLVLIGQKCKNLISPIF